jgi:hypothetical protein
MLILKNLLDSIFQIEKRQKVVKQLGLRVNYHLSFQYSQKTITLALVRHKLVCFFKTLYHLFQFVPNNCNMTAPHMFFTVFHWQVFLYMVTSTSWKTSRGRIVKLLRTPGIDSTQSIPLYPFASHCSHVPCNPLGVSSKCHLYPSSSRALLNFQCWAQVIFVIDSILGSRNRFLPPLTV